MSFQRINTEDFSHPEEKLCVLAFGYDKQQLSLLNEYLEKFEVPEYIHVTKKMLGLSLEEILDGKIEGDEFEKALQENALILSGFSGNLLNSFVHNFKDTNLPRPIFAVVTPTSIKWKFGDLIEELMLERAMMAKQKHIE